MEKLVNNLESQRRFPVALELTTAECELIALALNYFCGMCPPVVFCDAQNYRPPEERLTAEHRPLTDRFFQLSRQFAKECCENREREKRRDVKCRND